MNISINHPKDFVIMCDFDDTMNNLLPAWIRWINNTYGYNVDFEQITDWDLTKVFKGLSQTDICKALHSSEFWSQVEAKDDAVYYIKKLIEEGFQFYVCTSTDYRLQKDKFDNCLFRLFPYIDRHQIITTYKKQLMRCDILIDDGSHNIFGPYIGILMDMPHNRHLGDSVDFRVFNWKEIYNLIHQIYNAASKEKES